MVADRLDLHAVLAPTVSAWFDQPGATVNLAARQAVLANIPAPPHAARPGITCTYTNTYTPRSTLTLVKRVQQRDRGTEPVDAHRDRLGRAAAVGLDHLRAVRIRGRDRATGPGGHLRAHRDRHRERGHRVRAGRVLGLPDRGRRDGAGDQRQRDAAEQR